VKEEFHFMSKLSKEAASYGLILCFVFLCSGCPHQVCKPTSLLLNEYRGYKSDRSPQFNAEVKDRCSYRGNFTFSNPSKLYICTMLCHLSDSNEGLQWYSGKEGGKWRTIHQLPAKYWPKTGVHMHTSFTITINKNYCQHSTLITNISVHIVANSML
jgi:hypothetical protein